MLAHKVIALIPLRHQSQRVPGKNMKLLCGRPLFHWVVMALQASLSVEQIVIDTDSDDIARNALDHFNVKILKRPERLWGEMVGINDLIDFQISSVEGSYFLQTHSTNPLLKSETIDEAIRIYFDQIGQYDSLFAVTRLQTRLYWEDGRPVNHDPSRMLRTQDLSPIFEENSNLYVFSRDSFYKKRHRIGERPYMFSMNKLESVDIDEPEDFLMAETLMSERFKKGYL